MEILYRKDSSNEADGLSRLPELHHIKATAEQNILDKDLDDMHDLFVLHVSLTSECRYNS
jgi:hypothetical protein